MQEQEFLATYDASKYEKPSVTTDILLFTVTKEESEDIKQVSPKKMKLLLIKRTGHPYKDCWAIPGGFVDMEESLEEAAYRELREETNISEHVYLEQLYTFGTVKRDPRMRVISVAYMALTPAENIKQTKAGDDAKEAIWFDVSMLETADTIVVTMVYNEIEISYVYDKQTKQIISTSKDMLAFDHNEIVLKGLLRMKNKVEYTDIVFSLLPKKFTLMELQQIYELLLHKKVTKQNFRRKILPKVVRLEEMQEKTGFRPAYYYRYYKSNE